jgi:small GTP-binding protein
MAKYEAENLTVSQEPIATFKLVLLGHTGVGKTSLLAKYTSGQFNYSLMTTIGLDFKDKVVNVDGIPIRMRIWDTAGQERFETLTVQYLRGAQGVILVFDLTSEHTYDRLLKWLDETINILYQDIPVVVVGNKIDLEDKRCVHPRVHLGEVVCCHLFACPT